MAANNHTLSSFVAYVGVNESGHCGYCKSTRREKAKIAKVDQQETEQPQSNPNEGERESDDQNADDFQEEKAENSCEEREEGDSVIFGLIAHCLRLNSFNALLDLGLWAHRLTVQAYQTLVDHGWRRSGRYLYKPLMERTCCPQYTIRLDVHKFRLSRTQKRVLKTMQDFLKYDSKPSEKAIVREADAGNQQRELGKRAAASDEGHRKEQPEQSKRQKSTAQDGIERLPKKKELRRRRALERMQARGVDLDQYQRDRISREESRRKTVQKYLDEYPTDAGNESGWKHRLELRLVNQPSAELDADFDEEFELFKRYQMHVHEDDPEELSPSSFTRFLAASPLLPENDDEQEQPNNSTQKLGSFHQQYWLDGRIIAVGVVDILPHCFSAKYFFYDPDFAFLSLGTYSALREIAFTQQLAQQRPELHYYYMGYYLFDCPKMRYKGRFRPSELLCDHCFDWVPLTECQRLIAANGGRFCTFHPGAEKAKPELSPEELANIRCLFAQRHLVTFGKLRDALEAEEDGSEFKELLEKVQNFAHFAGPAAKEMALIL